MAKSGQSPTIIEVAQHAGVALSSVSRVINNHPDVSQDMRQRVAESMAALGYEPNLLAAGLRSGKSNTIGVIVAAIVNPLFAAMVNSAQISFNQQGYAAMVANSNANPERELELARLLRQRRVDALLISISDETHPALIDELRRFDRPVVLMDRQVPDLEKASAVMSDHAYGMQQATRHLLELGHRRIALLNGPDGIRPSAQRIASYRDTYQELGHRYPEELVRSGDFTPEFGEAATAQLLDLDCPPTALIAGGNRILIGMLRTLRHRGLQPGRDVSLVSCDDIPLSELYTPPITVIHRDIGQIGQAAAQLAMEHIDDPTLPPRTTVVPTYLILRESTRPV